MKTRRQEPGFTLVDLLVLLAMITLLACMILPAMAKTAPNTHAISCLNNLRQLIAGWRMYADDYQNRLVPNRTPTGTPSWVGGWLDFTPSNPDNTNVDYLVKSGNYGLLGPYVRSAALFKCPADKSAVTLANIPRPRVRSVSMNTWVGEGAEGWNGENFRLYKKLDDIVAPLPADLSVILDEHEGSINDGMLYTDPAATQNGADKIVDYPASRHDRAGGISFADGRAELHVWRDPWTCPPFSPYLPLNVPSPHNSDIEWLVSHSTSPR